mmetsp:Transcript_51350/g.133431  ORF Transcript_51350/g.133431 Transcript_51350/m.133431 type:complete len:566 (-) Transcript_51350:10-1707(-)
MVVNIFGTVILAASFIGHLHPRRPGCGSVGHISCCSSAADDTELPDAVDADSIAEHARAALRASILDGGLSADLHFRINARLHQLDPTDEEFDRRAFVHVALQCVRAIDCVTDGDEHVILLPSLHTLAAAEEAVADEWPAADRKRLRLGLLDHIGEPADDQPRLASVLVAGFKGSEGSTDDSPANRNACAWLRHSKIAVCLNSDVRLLRFELAQYKTAFAYEPHTIWREVLRFPRSNQQSKQQAYSERLWIKTDEAAEGREWASQGEDAVAVQRLGRALIYHAHPAPWQVLMAFGTAEGFERLVELPARPKDSELNEVIEPTVKARRAAIDAALRALRQLGSEDTNAALTTTAGQSPAPTLGPLSVAGAVGIADVQPGLTFCLSWAEVVAQSPEALSLYQAVALLRQRCYGTEASFAHDEVGVHIVQPYSAEEAAAARARSQAAQRLNGDLLGACLLMPNGVAEGVATIEQLAVQRDAEPEARAACAALLIKRALSECKERGQRHAIVPALPPLLQVEGLRWLAAAGFAPLVTATDGADGTTVPAELFELVGRGTAPGAVYRAVD